MVALGLILGVIVIFIGIYFISTKGGDLGSEIDKYKDVGKPSTRVAGARTATGAPAVVSEVRAGQASRDDTIRNMARGMYGCWSRVNSEKGFFSQKLHCGAIRMPSGITAITKEEVRDALRQYNPSAASEYYANADDYPPKGTYSAGQVYYICADWDRGTNDVYLVTQDDFDCE